MYGTEAGRRHDMTPYHNSGWDRILQETLLINGRQYDIFGDKECFLRA